MPSDSNSNNPTSAATSGASSKNSDSQDSTTASGSPTDGNKASTSGAAGSSSELVKHAKETVSHVAEQAVDLVESQLAQQQKKGVAELGSVAKALRGTRAELNENFAGPIVNQAVEQVERASKFLESASLGEIVDGVEDFARREPLLFVGGAFAVGMLGARFLKSSSRRTTADSSTNRPPQPMRTAARSRIDGPSTQSSTASPALRSNNESTPRVR